MPPPPYDPPPIPEDPLAGMSHALRSRLPNVIVIGAGKCGTTALHRQLQAHPDFSMAAAKEIQLFGGNRWLERLPSYPEYFEPAPLRGETSPSYSMDPYVPRVPEQMAAVLPEPRFVYLVGPPVRRVVAHWSEQRVVGMEDRSLVDALADAEDELNPYVAGSRYGHQLSRYLDVFGPDRVLVVDQRDLRERPMGTMRTVLAFLGADPDAPVAEHGGEANAVEGKLLLNALGRRRHARALAKGTSFAPARLRRLYGTPAPRPDLDEGTRARLEALLAPEVARLEALTGRNFGHWRLSRQR